MESKLSRDRLVVVGGGAAGFFAAVNAARMNRSLEVIILEKSDKLLSKVKISGGGRCNVAHACFSIAEMVRKYPRGDKFLKKAFHQFFTQDTVTWFTERGVPLKTEADGRMFPEANTSQAIIDCLLGEVARYGVQIRMKAEVKALSKQDGHFNLQLASGQQLWASRVLVASGGYPKSVFFDWLRHTGHEVIAPVPSLFTFNVPAHPLTSLMGLSVGEAEVKIPGTRLKERGPVLITHWGISGPAALRLSAWGAAHLAEMAWNCTLQINWLPQFHEDALRLELQQLRHNCAAQKVYAKNPFGLPGRLWEFILQQLEINRDCRWADLPAKDQNRLAHNLCAYTLEVKGKTTYKEEFVTAGGIALSDVDAQTMMSRKLPGLYFAGEVLNIDGITGGFNFQNAWTTAYIAAKNVAGI